jgi:predicted ArsR family transcriptional regulator
MRQSEEPPTDRLLVSPEQLKLMSYGPRRDIIAALANDRDLSARDLAERLKRPVTGLYRHLDLLEAADLIRQSGQRPGSNRPEALYALTYRLSSSDAVARTPEGRAAIAEVAARAAARAARRIRQAVDRDAARIGVADANASMRVSDLQLDRDGLIALNTLVEAFLADARKLRVPGSQALETVSLTILVAPQA